MCCHGNKTCTWLIPHRKSCPLKKRRFWSSPSPLLYFFSSNNANGTSNFADFLTNMCISNCVRSFFFFQTVVGSMWSGLLLLWHIKLIFLTSMWVVIYPWLTNYCYNNYRWTWIQILDCEFFFPFHLLFFLLFVVVFFISPCFYCLSCLLNLSNYKHKKMLD